MAEKALGSEIGVGKVLDPGALPRSNAGVNFMIWRLLRLQLR
jgi:hypothetical protein